jgi:spermidine synthase
MMSCKIPGPQFLNIDFRGRYGFVLTMLSRNAAHITALAVLVFASTGSWGDSLFDESVRAEMLKHRDGRVAHIESEYNDIFVNKRGSILSLSTRYKVENYLESMVNLKDPDDLPMEYAQTVPVGLLYPNTTKKILMIGLGAGSVSTYLGRALPDLQIAVVEIDPGVITAAKKYFGVQETDRVRIIESDGRVYLNRHKELYDLIVLDAYRELGIPFHLLTKEFFALVKEHLTPGGAVAMNIYGGTKLYVSTVVTLRAAFSTVDVYPVPDFRDETQVIAIATPAPAPSTETLAQRAVALQGQHHFRYPLPRLVPRRSANIDVSKGELLTDDFAPVGLYEVAPAKPRRRQ